MKLDRVIGVMKAYSSCVGAGPFVSEMFGDEAAALREAGANTEQPMVGRVGSAHLIFRRVNMGYKFRG